MPNHVTVMVKPLCDKKTFEKILSSITTNNKIDFQKIIPLDEEFKGFEPDIGTIDRAKIALGIKKDTYNLSSTPVENDKIGGIIKALQLYQKTGYCYWYDAQREEWGTKWNAYETILYDDQIEFKTAWSLPKPILLKLSSMNQDIVFEVRYADEDLGSNCGQLKILNGEIIDLKNSNYYRDTPEERREWVKFAFNLCHTGENPLDLGFDENFNFIDFW